MTRLRPLILASTLLTAAAPLAAEVTPGDAWWAHIEALANDGMEGRLTGSPGYDRATAYVVGQFKALGLEPAGEKGYLQPVAFIEQRYIAADSKAALVVPGGETSLAVPDIVYFRGGPMPPSVDAPMVFVGYGLHLPEVGYDDFKGADLKGKIAVVLAGGPPDISGALKSNARADRTKLLREMGAVGVIALTSPKQTEIPWARQILISSQPSMTYADPAMREVPSPIMTASLDPAKADLLFAGSGHGFAELAALADAGKPLPIFPLVPRFKATIAVRTAALSSPNIIARLPGSDPTLKAENVVVSAHLDGLGIGEPINGDRIYNGAFDDASGVASVIEIAKSLVARKQRPKRSILFTIVTAEEKGLLGSRYFAKRPTVPAGSIVADLNFDMPLPIFKLTSVTPLGYQESSLGDDAKAVGATMGLPIVPDPFPDRNTFIRSDQYSFIRQGIPSLFFKYGFTADSPEATIEKTWRATRYHSPSDDLAQPVMKDEAVKLDDFVTALTIRIADAPTRPTWNATSFFKRFAK